MSPAGAAIVARIEAVVERADVDPVGVAGVDRQTARADPAQHRLDVVCPGPVQLEAHEIVTSGRKDLRTRSHHASG